MFIWVKGALFNLDRIRKVTGITTDDRRWLLLVYSSDNDFEYLPSDVALLFIDSYNAIAGEVGWHQIPDSVKTWLQAKT